MLGMNEIVYLLFLSSSSFIVLFFIAKLLGKRQVAQLEFIDYVVGISIGSIAAEMATDLTDRPFYYYIIAMGVFFLLDIFVNLIGRKSPKLKHFFKGRPLTIIYEGELVYENIKKSKLDVNDVIALSREQGYFDLSDIAYAVFENSGKLSIMPIGTQKPTVAQDLDIKIKQAELPYYLIVDGVISYSSLTELNKDKTWLKNELKLPKGKKIKDVILAIYDSENQKVDFVLKNN